MMLTFAVALAMAGAQSATIPITVTPKAGQPAQPGADVESPEEVAKDSARDLKDSRFYNKPGATRAEYDAAWQECRLIARGSRTPGSTIPVVYNPAVISPVMAGAAGGLGGLIGQAIVEGQIRRANRQSCLLVRGWRLVSVPDSERARVSALTDAERDSYFATIVGAKDPPGKIQSWDNSFAAPKLAPEAEQ